MLNRQARCRYGSIWTSFGAVTHKEAAEECAKQVGEPTRRLVWPDEKTEIQTRDESNPDVVFDFTVSCRKVLDVVAHRKDGEE